MSEPHPATVGIKEVARRAGVSPGTVSNVLNRPERVASVTRERVERAIVDLGFVRNGWASTLRAGQGRTIGLMVLDFGNPFFADVARGVEDVAGERGYVLLRQAGVDVPGQVALIGYDDIEFAAAAAIPLSSIRQPIHRLGQIATELLLDECDNPAGYAHQQIMFQPELVVRESSR